MQARVGDPWRPGFVPLDQLSVDGELARVRARIGTSDPRALAASLVGDLAAPGAIAAAALVTESRVPVVRRELVAVRPWLGDDDVVLTAFRSPAVACLRRDPASTHPDAEPMRDEDALMERLRRDLVHDGFRALIEDIRARTRFSRKAMWGLVAWTIAETCAATATTADQRERAVATVDALCAPGSMLGSSPPRWQRADVGDVSHLVPVGGACCLAYRWVAGGARCRGCPLLTAEERVARLSSS
jgi:hypothetical protein